MKGEKVFIIAEAGVNHNGDLETALAMVEAAARTGADAIKFQTFRAVDLATGFASKAEYQKRTTASGESQLTMLKGLELDEAAHVRLVAECREQEIMFLSSPFDLASVEFLERLGIEIFKIPSGEITNLPYLRRVGKSGKPVILSSGMAALGEIEAALEVLELAGTSRAHITILHCNTEYPTSMMDVNLRAMLTIRDAFDVAVGYSDHSVGIEVPIAAVALGASVIEKHFTLDRDLPGPDHKASSMPHEFKAMVSAIRNIEQALGDGIKRPSVSESKNKPIVRKSLVAACAICESEPFTENNLAVKRPGTGLSPMRWDEVLGHKSPRDFAPDELIEL